MKIKNRHLSHENHLRHMVSVLTKIIAADVSTGIVVPIINRMKFNVDGIYSVVMLSHVLPNDVFG